MAGQSRKWMILVATIWIQAFTGTNFDFSAYSSDLKSVMSISQVQLNYLAVASDFGKAFGWSSGLALMHLPLWTVLFMAALMGLIGYGIQWLVIRGVISLPYPLVFLLCLLAGCSICWFNTVCFVLCNRNFPANRALAISLTVSFNGVSAALYTLAANSIDPSSDALYLLLNAIIPLLTSIAAFIPIIRQPSLDPLPPDAVQRDNVIFLLLNFVAVITGLYLLFLSSAATDQMSACLLFAGAIFLLVFPLFIPGIVYARDWFMRTLQSSFHLDRSGFILVDEADLELHRELSMLDGSSMPLLINGNESSTWGKSEGCCGTVIGKDQLVMLGEEHRAWSLVRRFDFWLYYISYFCGGTIGLVYSNNLGQIAQSLGHSSQTTALITLYSSFSFFGRLLSAAPDYIRAKFYFARTAAVSITSELFGPNSVGVNHNILITNIPLGSLLYGLAAAIVYDANANNSSNAVSMATDSVVCWGRRCYFWTFLCWGCISLLGLASSVLLFLRTRPAYDRFEHFQETPAFIYIPRIKRIKIFIFWLDTTVATEKNNNSSHRVLSRVLLGKKNLKFFPRLQVTNGKGARWVSQTTPFGNEEETTYLDFGKQQQHNDKDGCNVTSPRAKVGVRPARSQAAVTLDFESHHQSEINSSEAVNEFPPCDMSYSEYTPCQDPRRARKFDRDRLKYRERHCPSKDELLLCLIPAPPKYKTPLKWPQSRDYAWYDNIPHKELSIEKAVQNWIQVEGDRFRFPGGGTMFPRGADAYIDDINALIHLTGGNIRTAIDTGCGVASWGAYLLKRDILTMSFAPRDTHEAQVQFALERGVPAMIGIMSSQRLPYPARAFDMAHCSRCLIPWFKYDGLYLIEVDRILRPGGYWILSGPPIHWKKHWRGWERTQEDLKQEQDAIENVAKSLCWKKVVEQGDLAIWKKPINHIECIKSRKIYKTPHICKSENADAAWYKDMEACITPLPQVSSSGEVAGGELEKWPERAFAIPPRISSGSISGITSEKFQEDNELWKERVTHYKRIVSPLAQGRYRNVMDMNSYLGGFAAAILKYPAWVMNVVPANSNPDTLGIVYERGLIGTYHDWCEAFSTYPRTYDLIHAGGVFSIYQDRCDITYILLEMDRILRPEGTVIFRDTVEVLVKIKSIGDGMRWKTQIMDHESGPFNPEKILVAVKTYWTGETTQKPS
ncbi:hypothetical protein Nepgr_011461 [Nepenthes gracilis]|uniref:Methyltransferase n=1 Tax=Nepenthes gracilis TaxID=150966 RepID=A0AAD3SE41_NEPGR|nr:hypothetical protein Nepgr_011461 [Nepenthes gracilis]